MRFLPSHCDKAKKLKNICRIKTNGYKKNPAVTKEIQKTLYLQNRLRQRNV